MFETDRQGGVVQLRGGGQLRRGLCQRRRGGQQQGYRKDFQPDHVVAFGFGSDVFQTV
ncbi:MAG: hypothetical protein N4A53_08555 [Pelagimonas sp.]|jgi:hypothetical protein|nr:hypothetical protein [Pelagimonas sp.]